MQSGVLLSNMIHGLKYIINLLYSIIVHIVVLLHVDVSANILTVDICLCCLIPVYIHIYISSCLKE